MKLPGSTDAIVEIAKLRDYCLNPHHPRGRHKARVFLATLELAREDAEFLRGALIQAARETEAVTRGSDPRRSPCRYPERLDRTSRRNGTAADQLFCTIKVEVRNA